MLALPLQTPESKEDLSRRLKDLKNKLKFVRTRIYSFTRLMRKFSLGQDRFARQYWVLPSVGGVIVEGVETSLDRTLQPDFVEVEENATVNAEPVADSAPPAEKANPTLADNSDAASSLEKMSGVQVGGERDNETSVSERDLVSCEKDAVSHLDSSLDRTKEVDPATEKTTTCGESFEERGEGISEMEVSASALSSGITHKSEVMERGATLAPSGGVTIGSQDKEEEERRDQLTPAERSTGCDQPAQEGQVQCVATGGSSAVSTSAGCRGREDAGQDSNDSEKIDSTVESTSDKNVHEPLQSTVPHQPALFQSSSTSASPDNRLRGSETSGREGEGDRTKVSSNVDVLSCQESLEEEGTDRHTSKAAVKSRTLSPQPMGAGAADAQAKEGVEGQQHLSPPKTQIPSIADGSQMASSLSTPTHHMLNHAHISAHSQLGSSSPWFSLFPRDVCESVRVAYVNNQAVLVDANPQPQQQPAAVQHVLATDAAGHQYIMAAPSAPAAAAVPAATATAAATAGGTPQYAYVTPDGQIIPVAAGQNQVVQQVTDMGYALVGNTLVQVPQTQYVAVNASGQQFVIAGGVPGQAPTPWTNQQAGGGVQYVAAVNPSAASSASSAAAGGQQYIAVVEKEGGGQMIVQVGTAEQQGAIATGTQQQQYVVQTTGGPAATTSLVAAAAEQQQVASNQTVARNAAAAPSSSQPRYGIVNSDGTITVLSEEDLASYGAALATGGQLSSSVVSGESSNSLAFVQTPPPRADAVSAAQRGSGGADGKQRVKVEIEVPDQYPQVYIKTEPEEEEEEEKMELGVASSLSRQTAILGQSGSSGQLLDPHQSGAGQSSESVGSGAAVSIKGGVVQGSGSVVQTVDTTVDGDGSNQQVTIIIKREGVGGGEEKGRRGASGHVYLH